MKRPTDRYSTYFISSFSQCVCNATKKCKNMQLIARLGGSVQKHISDKKQNWGSGHQTRKSELNWHIY